MRRWQSHQGMGPWQNKEMHITKRTHCQCECIQTTKRRDGFVFCESWRYSAPLGPPCELMRCNFQAAVKLAYLHRPGGNSSSPRPIESSSPTRMVRLPSSTTHCSWTIPYSCMTMRFVPSTFFPMIILFWLHPSMEIWHCLTRHVRTTSTTSNTTSPETIKLSLRRSYSIRHTADLQARLHRVCATSSPTTEEAIGVSGITSALDLLLHNLDWSFN